MSLDGTAGRVIARHGATYTLRRVLVGAGPNVWTSGAGTVSYSQFKGREINSDAKAIQDTLTEGEGLITVDAKTAIVTPIVGDRVALGTFAADGGAEWRQITNVYPVREGGKLTVYKLTVRA